MFITRAVTICFFRRFINLKSPLIFIKLFNSVQSQIQVEFSENMKKWGPRPWDSATKHVSYVYNSWKRSWKYNPPCIFLNLNAFIINYWKYSGRPLRCPIIIWKILPSFFCFPSRFYYLLNGLFYKITFFLFYYLKVEEIRQFRYFIEKKIKHYRCFIIPIPSSSDAFPFNFYQGNSSIFVYLVT